MSIVKGRTRPADIYYPEDGKEKSAISITGM
jgi:hypothetical protein